MKIRKTRTFTRVALSLLAAPIVLGTVAAASADTGYSEQNYGSVQYAGPGGATDSYRGDVTNAHTGGYGGGAGYAATEFGGADHASPGGAYSSGQRNSTTAHTDDGTRDGYNGYRVYGRGILGGLLGL